MERYDKALTRIPAFEKSLSHVLRNIKVGRRLVFVQIFLNDAQQAEYKTIINKITNG